MSENSTDLYHCHDCGFEWDSGELGGGSPPHPWCPECEDSVLRVGPADKDDHIGDGMPMVPLERGQGIMVMVDDTIYETKTIYPLARGQHAYPEDAKSILLQPYPSGGIKSRDDPEVEISFVPEDHGDAVAAFFEDESATLDSVLDSIDDELQQERTFIAGYAAALEDESFYHGGPTEAMSQEEFNEHIQGRWEEYKNDD